MIRSTKTAIALSTALVALAAFLSCVSQPKAPAETPAPVAEEVAAEPTPGPGEVGGIMPDGSILWDSFEDEYTWESWKGISSEWGPGDPVWSATGCEVIESDKATDRTHVLKMSFAFNGNSNKEENSINRAPYNNQPGNLLDLSGYTTAKADIFNESKVTVHLSLVLATGDGWSWQRSSRVDIVPGMNKDVTWNLVRDISQGDTDPFKDLNNIKVCVLDLFGGPENTGKSGALYLDNLRFFK